MVEGSYLLLAVGMIVQSESGETLGHVADVVADENADIFRGIVVSPGLFQHDVFVVGEHVVSVADDKVTVDLDTDQLAQLPNASDMVVRTSA